MTWVKVCGLTREVDVATAVDAGADAVGFVSHPGSPRYVSIPMIADLARGVSATRVILTVDMGVKAALTAVEATAVDAIQPYGSQAGAVAAAAIAHGVVVLLPIRATADFVLPDDDGSIPLFDTPRRRSLGWHRSPVRLESRARSRQAIRARGRSHALERRSRGQAGAAVGRRRLQRFGGVARHQAPR